MVKNKTRTEILLTRLLKKINAIEKRLDKLEGTPKKKKAVTKNKKNKIGAPRRIFNTNTGCHNIANSCHGSVSGGCHSGYC